MKTCLLFLTTSLLGASLGVLSAAPPIGAPAPAFTLTDTNGKTHSLADFKGKTVVLEWTNFGCPFVGKHYNSGNMQALQREATAEKVVWLSICSSAPGKQGQMSPGDWNKALAAKKSAATAVLLDEDGKVGRAYEARTTPQMFVINPEGNLIYEGAIDDKPSADPQDIAGATNYVRAALQTSLAGQPVAKPVTQSYGCSVKY